MTQWTQIADLSLKLPVVDLSFPGDISLSIEGPRSFVAGTHREYCYLLGLSTQAGTHVQGAHYFLRHGKTIDQYPLTRFEGFAHVVQCYGAIRITPELLQRSLVGRDRECKMLIFFTGFTETLVSISSKRRLLLQDLEGKPGLTSEAARMIAELGFELLGIDSTGFEPYPSDDHHVNRFLCEKDIILLENLEGLRQLPHSKVWLECFPLPIVGVEGTPCRAIAKW